MCFVCSSPPSSPLPATYHLHSPPTWLLASPTSHFHHHYSPLFFHHFTYSIPPPTLSLAISPSLLYLREASAHFIPIKAAHKHVHHHHHHGSKLNFHFQFYQLPANKAIIFFLSNHLCFSFAGLEALNQSQISITEALPPHPINQSLHPSIKPPP